MKKKALLVVLSAAVLVAASVFGTMAYLTDAESVTNTFTIGQVHITLDEFDYDNSTEGADRDTENEYHLLPGHEYVKDPTVTVLNKSENAYIRMIVTVERMDQLKAALPNSGDTADYYDAATNVFLLQKLVKGWDDQTWLYQGYAEDGTSGEYEFRYKDIVNGKNGDTTLDALFDAIYLPGKYFDNESIEKLADVEINVEAHAMQADGFATAADAWKNFN